MAGRIRELRTYGIDPGEAAMSWRSVHEDDWADAWKQYFKPARITSKLTIKPSWEPYTPTAEEQVIELDPGMAFGTGTHPTTSLCLQALESVIQGGKRSSMSEPAPASWRSGHASSAPGMCLPSTWIR